MKTNLRNISHIVWSSYSLIIKNVILSTFLLTGIQPSIMSQVAHDMKHSWWFGATAGANINFYRGSTQELNSVLTSPAAFHKGMGVGLYLAPLVEFHNPGSILGIMLQAGYDNRMGTFDQKIAPCNCDVDLSTNLSYITVEPSLLFAPFKNRFFLYAGPRLAFNMHKSFSYIEMVNSDILNQKVPLELNGNFDNMNKTIISMQIGAGYDIPFSSKRNPTQFVFSPFVSFHPYYGQSPRSIETWNITTLRAGAALKFSQRKLKTNHRKWNKRLY